MYVRIYSCILYIAAPHCWAICIRLLWRFPVQKDLFYKLWCFLRYYLDSVCHASLWRSLFPLPQVSLLLPLPPWWHYGLPPWLFKLQSSPYIAINHQANSSVILYLPLSQPLLENAVTLNMAKYNTVPTNRRDDMGNIVTEMVTRITSIVFGELEFVRWDICIL